MVFTRIDPKNPDTSMIVHIRPGWNDLYAYLCGDEKGAAPNAIRGAAAKDADLARVSSIFRSKHPTKAFPCPSGAQHALRRSARDLLMRQSTRRRRGAGD